MTYTGPSPSVLAVVKARAGGACLRCGTRAGAQCHHRLPRGMGGSRRPEVNRPANCVWLCPPCHARIESQRSEAFAHGWLVRRNGPDLPADVPLTDLAGRVFFLSDDGGLRVIAEAGQPPF